MYKLSVYKINDSLLMPMAESFGKQLKRYREKAGINQAELARRTKLSAQYISILERDTTTSSKSGVTKPTEEVVEIIARAIHWPIDEARIAAGYVPKSNTIEPAFALAKSILVDFEKLTEEDRNFFFPYLRMMRCELDFRINKNEPVPESAIQSNAKIEKNGEWVTPVFGLIHATPSETKAVDLLRKKTGENIAAEHLQMYRDYFDGDDRDFLTLPAAIQEAITAYYENRLDEFLQAREEEAG